jgi:hypothetical protein
MKTRKFLTVAGAVAAALVLAPASLAKGPPASSSSSLRLVLMNSTDGFAHWGQSVTFNVSTTATSRPFVGLNCYQNGAWVYTSSVGYYPGYPWDQFFTLMSGNWTTGAADCTATLYAVNSRGRQSNLASLSFHVYA